MPSMTNVPQGTIPDSWNCIDCNTNTAPGLYNRAEVEAIIAAIGKAAWKNGAGIAKLR